MIEKAIAHGFDKKLLDMGIDGVLTDDYHRVKADPEEFNL